MFLWVDGDCAVSSQCVLTRAASASPDNLFGGKHTQPHPKSVESETGVEAHSFEFNKPCRAF